MIDVTRAGRTTVTAARVDSTRAGASSSRVKKGRVGRDASDRKGVAPMADAVKDFLRMSGIGAKLGPLATFRAFQQAAGPAFARYARPVRLARGELVVEVSSAAHLAELKGYHGEDIRVRTNQLLGNEDVRRITFRLQR